MFDEADDKKAGAASTTPVAPSIKVPSWKLPVRQPVCNADLARNVTNLLLWCLPILGGASTLNFIAVVIGMHTKGYTPSLSRALSPRLMASLQKNPTAVERLEAAAALAVRSFDSYCIFAGTQGNAAPFNFRLATDFVSHEDYAGSVNCAENAFATFVYTQAKALEAQNKLPTVN